MGFVLPRQAHDPAAQFLDTAAGNV